MSVFIDICRPLTGGTVLSKRDFPLDGHHIGVLSLQHGAFQNLSDLPVVMTVSKCGRQSTRAQTDTNRIRLVSYHVSPTLYGFICNSCICCAGPHVYAQAHQHYRNVIASPVTDYPYKCFLESIEGHPIPEGVHLDQLRKSIVEGIKQGHEDYCAQKINTHKRRLAHREYPVKIVMLVRSDLVDQKAFDKMSQAVQRHLAL